MEAKFLLCLLMVQILAIDGGTTVSSAFAAPFANLPGHRPKHDLCNFASRDVPPSPLTRVFLSNQNNDDKNMGKITGTDAGVWLLGFALIFNIWAFSIPVEFRRARVCSAEQVELYPESKCMTTEMWLEGVTEYYKNGGGVSFDFSIEGQE